METTNPNSDTGSKRSRLKIPLFVYFLLCCLSVILFLGFVGEPAYTCTFLIGTAAFVVIAVAAGLMVAANVVNDSRRRKICIIASSAPTFLAAFLSIFTIPSSFGFFKTEQGWTWTAMRYRDNAQSLAVSKVMFDTEWGVQPCLASCAKFGSVNDGTDTVFVDFVSKDGDALVAEVEVSRAIISNTGLMIDYFKTVPFNVSPSKHMQTAVWIAARACVSKRLAERTTRDLLVYETQVDCSGEQTSIVPVTYRVGTITVRLPGKRARDIRD